MTSRPDPQRLLLCRDRVWAEWWQSHSSGPQLQQDRPNIKLSGIRQAGEQGPERRKRSRRSQERVDQTSRFSVGGERSRGRVRRPKFKSVFPRPSAKTVKRFSPFFFYLMFITCFFGVCMLGCQCTSSWIMIDAFFGGHFLSLWRSEPFFFS